MANSYSCNLVHCVFSTKDRKDVIRDPEALWRYFAAVARAKNILLIKAGGTANHVHLLFALRPDATLAAAVQALKANSSRWLRESAANFAWQRGYGAFSVGQSQTQVVKDYIAHQAEHHRKWNFEQEFTTMLRQWGVEYDPRFVLG